MEGGREYPSFVSSLLYVAISSHGFGHLAQTAPVVQALRRRLPGLRVMLRTGVPEKVVGRYLRHPFRLFAEPADPGMCMTGALGVDTGESHRAYLTFHREWEARVEGEVARLRELGPELVLSNVPYLVLEAASRAGIPSVAMCSLNWADIFAWCCRGMPGTEDILRTMEQAYNSADCFLQPEPSMDMPGLKNRRPVGPVARIGRDRAEELRKRLGLSGGRRIVLAMFGGVSSTMERTIWPRLSGITWLVPGKAQEGRPDVAAVESIGIPYIDGTGALPRPRVTAFPCCICPGRIGPRPRFWWTG
jgi:hypothetical protein